MSSTQAIVRKDPSTALKEQLQSKGMTQALADAVPVTARKYLTPERIVRIVTTAAARTPALLRCEPTSILRSVVDLVQLGLEPGGPLGHAYLVPYGSQCQPIVGYQGYLALARRSGEIESVFAQVIYSRDTYRISYGDEPHIEHEPCIIGERGDPIAVYCVAKFKDGGRHLEVMTAAEVDAIRRRSKASGSGPWVTDWGQMARKTVIRRARHYWPISVEMAQAAELDDRIDVGEYVEGGALETVEQEQVQQPKTRKLADKLRAKREPEPAHDASHEPVEPEREAWDVTDDYADDVVAT